MSDGNLPQDTTPEPQQVQKAEPTPVKPKAKPKKKGKFADITHVVIRPLPKAVFLYPTCLACFICGTWQALIASENEWLGLFFLVLLSLNILVMAFEFSRVSSLAFMMGGTTFIFGGLWAGSEYQWDVFQALGNLFKGLHIYANSAFYFSFGVVLLGIFGCIFIKTRFDYWVVTHNELLHYHGVMGNVERYPAPNLRITKEIDDIVEFLLLQSGRLIIYPASELRTIVLDNIPRVNTIERALNELLSKIIVKTQ